MAAQTTFYQERPYQAVSLSHFSIDVLNSSRNLIIALLAIDLGLTNAQVGLTLLVYNIGSSLSQPFFGWLADRVGARWFVIGGLGWMILFFSIAAVGNDWVALGALTIAGIGSGMFHPAGTMVASQTSQTATGRATSIFFFSGQFGLFVGPIIAGVLLTTVYGRSAYILIPLACLSVFFYGWRYLSNSPAVQQAQKAARATARNTISMRLPQVLHRGILLTIIILAGSTVSIAIITFAPKLFSEMGYIPLRVGILSGLIMLGSSFGGILGGTLGDRIAAKWVIVLGMSGQILPIFFYIPAVGATQALLLFIAGFFGGMPHTILVLSIQSLFPGRQAMASGLALGLMFTGGAIGSYLVGVLADEVGLAMVLRWTAVLPLIALLAALLLPKNLRDHHTTETS